MSSEQSTDHPSGQPSILLNVFGITCLAIFIFGKICILISSETLSTNSNRRMVGVTECKHILFKTKMLYLV